MNIQESDVLLTLLSEPYDGQRALSEATGHSLGVVNRSIRNLRREGYLDEQTRPTDKAKRESREKAPQNAVILADGFGMRTDPGNPEKPMGLFTVRGEPLIERTIRQLHEVGIEEIYVVVGFLKEQYEYLIDAYGVELIVNPHYASRGTLFSLSLALPHLSNTYIIPCGIWCGRNPYRRHELYSWYMVNDSLDSKSTVRANRKMELVPTTGQTGGNAVIGITYLLEERAAAVRGRVREACGECGEALEAEEGPWQAEEKPWEAALYGEGRMTVPARVVRRADAEEIHTPEQLHRLQAAPDRTRSDVLAVCRRALGALPEGFVENTAIGTTVRSFTFSCKEKGYIVRIPGECVNGAADFGPGTQVYTLVSGKGICAPLLYVCPENGCKIMELPDGTRFCDPKDADDVRRCMIFLRHIHDMGIKVGHKSDVFERILCYENLWEGKPSSYKDYERTREGVFSLKPYIDRHVEQKVLTHMDTAPWNFLICGGMEEKGTFSGKSGGGMRLVGWEYAGMHDPHMDIAMFCTAALYNRKRTDEVIEAYFEGCCPEETRIKIYCYIAVCGLLRSSWCEYRMKQGEEFGEYSLRQYRYAKEYYRIVREDLASREASIGI